MPDIAIASSQEPLGLQLEGKVEVKSEFWSEEGLGTCIDLFILLEYSGVFKNVLFF